MLRIIHLITAAISILCIATFVCSTIIVEIFFSNITVASVKTLIVTPGLCVLIPSIAITGITGFVLSKTRKGKLIDRKKARMPIIGMNGILVLVPSAIFLDIWAEAGLFNSRFYLVQGLEFIVGMINTILMSKNIRDGFRLSGFFQRNSNKQPTSG